MEAPSLHTLTTSRLRLHSLQLPCPSSPKKGAWASLQPLDLLGQSAELLRVGGAPEWAGARVGLENAPRTHDPVTPLEPRVGVGLSRDIIA